MKTKKKELHDKKHFFVVCDTFQLDIAIFVNHSEQEIIKKMSRFKGVKEFLTKYYNDTKDNDTSTQGYMVELPTGFILSFNFKKDSFRKNCGIIVHEVTHLVQYTLRNRRIPLNEDTEEIYAYMTEEIVKKILLKLY